MRRTSSSRAAKDVANTKLAETVVISDDDSEDTTRTSSKKKSGPVRKRRAKQNDTDDDDFHADDHENDTAGHNKKKGSGNKQTKTMNASGTATAKVNANANDNDNDDDDDDFVQILAATIRASAAASASPMTSSTSLSATARSSSISSWTCDVCTFINAARDSKKCAMCEQPRPDAHMTVTPSPVLVTLPSAAPSSTPSLAVATPIVSTPLPTHSPTHSPTPSPTQTTPPARVSDTTTEEKRSHQSFTRSSSTISSPSPTSITDLTRSGSKGGMENKRRSSSFTTSPPPPSATGSESLTRTSSTPSSSPRGSNDSKIKRRSSTGRAPGRFKRGQFSEADLKLVWTLLDQGNKGRLELDDLVTAAMPLEIEKVTEQQLHDMLINCDKELGNGDGHVTYTDYLLAMQQAFGSALLMEVDDEIINNDSGATPTKRRVGRSSSTPPKKSKSTSSPTLPSHDNSQDDGDGADDTD